MVHRFRQLIEWLGSHGWLVIFVVLLIVGGTWAFVALTDEVKEGDTQRFDDWAVRAMRRSNDLAKPIGPDWLSEVGRDMTAIGGIAVLSLVTFAVAGYLAMVRKYGAMLLVLGATIGGLLISSLLKGIIARDRPHLVPHLSLVYTSSFPSGHSMLSAVVYLTLGSLLTRLAPGRTLKTYFLGMALLLTCLVGISRVYMGVHYPTDVLAGWTAGLVWALICWVIARALQRKHIVERDEEEIT
jgi:undecaprenyl-diphosphatase